MDTEQKQFTYEDLTIHFDLANNKHEIPILQSITTEQSLNSIIQELNKQLFNGQIEIHLVVLPTEEGSLRKKFGVWIYIAGGFVLSQMFPDTMNGVIKGLTGKEWKEHVEAGTIQVKQLVVGFLEKDNHNLIEFGVSPQQFYRAYEAKNRFYQSALSNDNVRGIGFDHTNNFPVKTGDFYHRIYDLKEINTGIEPIDKYHKLTVVSAINTKEDKDLAWQVKDPKIKKRFGVYMKDKDFYDFFLEGPIYISSMIVKVRYYLSRDEDDQITIDRKEIIRVYQYNNTVFFPLPEDAHIEPAPMMTYEIDGAQRRTKDEENSNDLQQDIQMVIC